MISRLPKIFLIFTLLLAINSLCYANDNSVTLFVDYGEGFEFLSQLDFDKNVSEKSLMVDKSINSLRVVRGECYDLNLDRLTLNSVSPKGFERKLSATDKDLLEVVDSIDFDLQGKGELVISARTPKDIKGEEYSAKFPTCNRGVFLPSSSFYNYTLGTNFGAFLDDDSLSIPDKEFFFTEEMVYPNSGHPNAPVDFYIANDDDTLYVFFETFVDNTLDNGKDFACVQIKCNDELKTYKVYTTTENEYGRWWFEYTNSNEEYDWQHMLYLVKVPLADIKDAGNELDIGFEYYGTVHIMDKLSRLGVGDVYYVDQYTMDNENADNYYDDTVRILPAPGITNNIDNGDSAEGEWWITNTGTEEEPSYTLYLNNANIDTTNDKYSPDSYVTPYGSITIELVDGTENTIGVYGDGCARWALEAISSLNLVVQGNGILNLCGEHVSLRCYGTTTIRDGAVINGLVSCNRNGFNVHGMEFEKLVVDNASLYSEVKNISNNCVAFYCYNTITLNNDAILECYAYSGDNNYGFTTRIISNLVYDEDNAVLKEGTSPDEAQVVDGFINIGPYSDFMSNPYVLIEQKVPTEIESISLSVVNAPKGGKTTEEVGNNLEISGESEEITYTAYNYAEDLDKAKSGEWFEGTYETGASMVAVLKLRPNDGYFISQDTEINIEGASIVANDFLLDDDNNQTGEILLYLSITVLEDEEEVPTYTISFDANGGSGNMDDVKISGDKYTLPANKFTAPSGKVFDKWDLGKVGTEITISGDTNIVAQWKNKPSSGGGGSSTSNRVKTIIGSGTLSTKKVEGKSKAREFIFVPNEGYEITDVLLDGVSLGKISSYVIEDITKKQTLEFKTDKIRIWTNVDAWVKIEMELAEAFDLIPETFARKDFTKPITRKEFTAVAVRLYEKLSRKRATPVSNNPFTDTNDEYVLKAFELGITKGTSETTFTPDSQITREQMATMLTRTVHIAGFNTNVDYSKVSLFEDDNLLNGWGRDAVYFMSLYEIINGVGNNRFNPLGNAKVEEALALSLRCTQVFISK